MPTKIRTAEGVLEALAGCDYHQALYLTDLETAAEAALEAFEYFPATDRLRDLCQQVLAEIECLGVADCQVVPLTESGQG